MKILAIVVTYYPLRELLLKNIQAFLDEVDKVLVWENTPISEKEQYRFIEGNKIEYCSDGINSISRALNFAWKYASSNGYDYLLTMDQDSVFDNFVCLKKYAEDHYHEKILLGPSLNRNDYELDDSNPSTKMESIITSGSLIYVEILEEIGGYDERLEIDGIDTDLCLRASQKGIYSYQINNCNIKQRFGKPEYKYLLGKKYLLSTYSSKRLESILTSHIYLIRKHRNMSKEMKKHIIRHYIIERIRDIVFFEDDKINKIICIIIGIVKGFFIRI